MLSGIRASEAFCNFAPSETDLFDMSEETGRSEPLEADPFDFEPSETGRSEPLGADLFDMSEETGRSEPLGIGLVDSKPSETDSDTLGSEAYLFDFEPLGSDLFDMSEETGRSEPLGIGLVDSEPSETDPFDSEPSKRTKRNCFYMLGDHFDSEPSKRTKMNYPEPSEHAFIGTKE